MTIRRSAITQYFLIYIMLIMSYSCMATFYLNQNILYCFILGIFGLLYITHKQYRRQYAFIGVFIIFTGVVFQRLLNGGVGISAFLQISIPIICTHMSICADKEKFLDRYIKVVCFFATVSIVFWGIFLVAPELVDKWPAVEYFTQALGTGEYKVYWHGKGVLLYSFLEIHPTRNCGIYSEPGVYQIVLNSALFVLLFWKEKLHYEDIREYYKHLLIILVALVTCQSTTGFLSLFILLVFYMLQNKGSEGKKIKRRIVLLSLFFIIFLLVEYFINGYESILYNQVIFKLFGNSKTFTLDVSQGSGQYRMGTILYCLDLIVKHPFGVGYDAFNAGKDTSFVAASLLTYACIYGVIIWGMVLTWLWTPVIKRQKAGIAIAFILMFINTTLGQTMLLYPPQLLIPIYLTVVGAQKQGG